MVRARFTPFLFTCALVLAPSTSTAQVPAESLRSGERLRYELAQRHADVPAIGEGYFLALTPAAVSMTVEQGRTQVEIPRDRFADLDVARGKSTAKWPMAIIVGAAGCVVTSVALKNENDADDTMHEMAVPIGCPLGFAIGGVLGAFLGKQFIRTEWERVELGGTP